MYPAGPTTRRSLVTDSQDVEGNYKLPQNDVLTVKQELIGLMISQPPSIQPQLGEAISTIADSDFYERWDTLVDVGLLKLEPRGANAEPLPGPRLAFDTGQPRHQQRCASGRTLDFQALETSLQIRRPLHRDQLCAGEICRPFPPAVYGTWQSFRSMVSPG